MLLSLFLLISLDFGTGGENVEVIGTQEFLGDPSFGTATTYLYKVRTYCTCTMCAAKCVIYLYRGNGFLRLWKTDGIRRNSILKRKKTKKGGHQY